MLTEKVLAVQWISQFIHHGLYGLGGGAEEADAFHVFHAISIFLFDFIHQVGFFGQQLGLCHDHRDNRCL